MLRTMNWEAVGAVAELVGAIGVIASLLYLAIQVRTNTRMMRTTAEQAAIDSFRNFQWSPLEADRPKIVRTGVEDLNALSEDERARFIVLVHEMFRTFENMYLLHLTRTSRNQRGA